MMGIQVIKFSQYLSGITYHQDPYNETVKVLLTFFETDFAGFGRKEGEHPEVHHLSCAKTAGCGNILTIVEKKMKEAVTETMVSGFLSTREMNEPEQVSLLCVPMTGARTTEEVLLIGRRGGTGFSRDSMELFLAAAGLIETTLKRILSERENLIGILEAMPDLVYIVSRNRDIIYSNPAFDEEFSGYDKTKCFRIFSNRTEKCPDCIYEKVIEGTTARWERTCIRNNKTYDIIETRLRQPDGSHAMLAILRDMTQMKENREKINGLLKEKELILTEVHHRIKNNMTTMKSLLALQQHSLDDPAAQQVLLTAENRLAGMMVLYEKLYKSEKMEAVDLAEYIPALVDEIVETFPLDVQLSISVEKIECPVKRASPLGIIINELVTNSMKYAFSEYGTNILTVSARRENGTKMIITVGDNGGGFNPEKVTEGFGLQLVDTMVKQLGGQFSREVNNGYSSILSIPL